MLFFSLAPQFFFFFISTGGITAPPLAMRSREDPRHATDSSRREGEDDEGRERFCVERERKRRALGGGRQRCALLARGNDYR